MSAEKIDLRDVRSLVARARRQTKHEIARLDAEIETAYARLDAVLDNFETKISPPCEVCGGSGRVGDAECHRCGRVGSPKSCARCGGLGRLEAVGVDGTSEPFDCPNCGGTGRAVVAS